MVLVPADLLAHEARGVPVGRLEVVRPEEHALVPVDRSVGSWKPRSRRRAWDSAYGLVQW